MGETIHEVNMVKGFWLYLFWVLILGFMAMAIFIPDQPAVDRIVLVVVGASMLLLVPDMKAVYGTDGIVLTFGYRGIWKKRIPKDQVTYIYVTEFSPMKDFGGWGIKGGWGRFKGVLMWAMPTKKPRAILVEMISGKKLLIGDESPDETLAMISGIYPVDPGSGNRG